MKPSLLKLHKFFKLESQRGYDNRAVVGGFEGMLTSWEAEARSESVPEELVQAVVSRLRDYNRLSPSSRQEALQGLWRRIQRSEEPDQAKNEPLAPAPPAQEPRKKQEISVAPSRPAKSRPPETPRPAASPVQKTPAVQLPQETPSQEVEAEHEHEHQAPAEVHTPAPWQRPQAPAPEGPPAAFQASVTVLPGVGPRHGETLGKMGLATLGDMLHNYPRRYDDYTKLLPINRLVPGQQVTVIASVHSTFTRSIRNGKSSISEVILTDGTGALKITWFNQPWVGKRMRKDMQLVVSGKVEQFLGRPVMNNPEWEELDADTLHTNRIVPVYSLSAQISQRWMRRLMHQVVSHWAPRVQEPLPRETRKSADLLDLPNALLQVHFPDSAELLRAARYRLAFDEVLMLQLGMLLQKRYWQDRDAKRFSVEDGWLEQQLSCLPFQLTEAQQRTLAEIRSDLASGQPMNRLLQGDVGSGKTVVAALAAAIVIQSQAQAALMAPTGILAEQHYRGLQRLLTGDGQIMSADEIRLMTGATPEAEKREIRDGLAAGAVKLIIGTHALIEDPVNFANLQLAIIDEQHRFGVEQRAALRNKGDQPHLLVMTATPIPRSLALTVYGDLDLAVIDEMPPGRQEISTHVMVPRERERVYSLIRSQVAKGRQAFVIYPLVEEGEIQAEQEGRSPVSRGAVEEQQRLQKEIFPDLTLGLLHGRMKADEKDDVMRRFRDGEVHVLVSTSVVEVGVDVPNATVMLIEGANRFGLAQLHQFRGRVGRGQEKSYCILIPETDDSAENERLQAMVETTDGFVLAQKDLEQRGPGDFLGTRQSGYADLRLASLTDFALIEKAQQVARKIFESDKDLTLPEHQVLAAAVKRTWGDQHTVFKSLGGDIS